MPHLIPVPVRQVIVQRAQQGQSASLIARCLGLVPRTVRQLLQRLRLRGQNALVASYPSQPYPHSSQFRALVEEAVQLRRAHPTWGAGLVRVLLHRHYPADPIPAERTPKAVCCQGVAKIPLFHYRTAKYAIFHSIG